MKKQKTLTFSKHFLKTYKKDYIPLEHFSPEDEFTAQILKQGYVPKDIKVQETITITCQAAKANIPLEERKKCLNQCWGKDNK